MDALQRFEETGRIVRLPNYIWEEAKSIARRKQCAVNEVIGEAILRLADTAPRAKKGEG